MTGSITAEEGARLVAALTVSSTIADPYALYDQLRPVAPIAGYRDYPPGTVPGQDEPVSAWVLLSYEDVSKAARDHRVFSSRDPLQEDSSAPTLMLVNHDNPEHDRLRNIVNLTFSRKRIEDEAAPIKEIVADLISDLQGRDVEVMDEISSVLPARVMVHLLGLPAEDADRFRAWATAFMLSADLTPEEREASNQTLATYFIEKVSGLAEALEAGKDVPPSLMRALLEAEVDGERLTLEEVIRFCITLVVAGAETTTFLLGNLLYNLATLPGVQARLRAEPDMLPRFIDETLRHSGPPQRLFRIALDDVTVGQAQIKKGDWVALFFGAANQDPEVFPDPRRFDMDRPNLNKQLTLGVGIHHCLGSALAKLEARVLLQELLQRGHELSLGGAFPVPQTASLLNHGFERLTLRFDSPELNAQQEVA